MATSEAATTAPKTVEFQSSVLAKITTIIANANCLRGLESSASSVSDAPLVVAICNRWLYSAVNFKIDTTSAIAWAIAPPIYTCTGMTAVTSKRAAVVAGSKKEAQQISAMRSIKNKTPLHKIDFSI